MSTQLKVSRPELLGADGLRLRVSALMCLLLSLSTVYLVTIGAPAQAAGAPAVSNGVDPANGFPYWFQDTTGVRVAPCLDASDPNCVLLGDAGFNPAQPLAFPSNFPEEFFYSITDSERLSTKGCSGTKPGKLSIRLALEGAFVNGPPRSGDQMVFGRVRLTLTGGLCRSSTYTATYPYGQLTFTTNSSGALAKNQGTTDVGCVPSAPAACDWSIALGSPVARSLPRWDPAVGPAAPAGYLGDAASLHRIIGATYTAPGEAAPANYFQVTGPSLSKPLRTDLFTVSGKIAGPLVASPKAIDFGGLPEGSPAAERQVTVTNLAEQVVTPGPATITGPAAADFSVTQDGCAGTGLARDASCTISVGFTPGALGSRSASLGIGHDAAGNPVAVALAGTGTAPLDEPKGTVGPASVDVGRQRIGTRSQTWPVRLDSTGTAPLQVGALVVGGADAGAFSVVDDTCSNQVVAVGASCTFGVVFAPTAVGAATASVSVPSNDAAGPFAVALAGEGYGGVAAVSSTVSPDDGFPDWYQDENGVRVGQCIDPTDPNCVVLPGGTFTGTTPLSFPDNFPDEFFYSVVDSDLITTPGCQGSSPGRAMVRMAIEGAFGAGNPVPGDQMTFGRIRINATGGLCPNTTYTFVHPYGVDQFTADADGQIKRTAGTEDVGCLGATPTTPCSFGDAVKSRVFEGLLRWDPAFGPAAPSGYLGDAATLHRITGAPFTPVGEAAPANYFKIYQGDTLIGQTSLFTVMGKLAGPLVADPSALDLGAAAVGQPAVGTVTLTNEGIADLTVDTTSVVGPHQADFAVPAATDLCRGQVLTPGAQCSLGVEFTPTAVGARSAQVLVTHSGLNNPVAVALSGTGLSGPGQAALSVSSPALGFEDLAVGRSSVVQTLTVSNAGGSAPLSIDGMALGGADAVDFAVVGNACTQPVDPGASCDLQVQYSPLDAGADQAALTIQSAQALPTSVTVGLSGNGFAGTSAVSATVRGDGFPEWYQDDNGVRLEPCLDPADTSCVVLAGDGFDPALPMSFPDNYPPELFYAIADSDLVTTPGCNGTAPGTGLLRLALEGAFGTPTAQDGQQLTFGRIRFNVTSGLCPGETYTITTPYGDFTAVADAAGGIARTTGTTDVGCGATPCAFGSALASQVLRGFVRWAPGVGAAAPAGYLGDGVSLHRIVGATHLVGGTPANYFEITAADGTSVAKTGQFIVSGKLASGLRADALRFPDQQINTASAPQSITFTNIATTVAPVAAVDVAGADSVAFQIGTSTCADVASDQSCQVEVRFAPTEVRGYAAEVRLLSATGDVLGRASVAGTGIDVGTARASVNPTSLVFGDQRVGVTSASSSVTVTNAGTVPLMVGIPVLGGPAAGDFAATAGGGCAILAPGASCAIAVTFTPTAAGARSASLTVPSSDPAGPATVSLSGNGISSVIELKSSSLDLGKVSVGRSTTKTMTVKNTGTAPLNITQLTLDANNGFTVSRGTCAQPVAPSRTCDISVAFTASGAAGPRTNIVRFVSDATSSPTLSLSATVQ